MNKLPHTEKKMEPYMGKGRYMPSTKNKQPNASNNEQYKVEN